MQCIEDAPAFCLPCV